MLPCYYALDCIPAADGTWRITDLFGGVGSGLGMLAEAYGGQAAARARLSPFLERLGEAAGKRRILFVHDPFTAGQTYPDDFFNLVQRFAGYYPITDWVPDLQVLRSANDGAHRTPELGEVGVFLDPLASRLRLKLAYCSDCRVDSQQGRPMVLLSGYRERARQRPTSTILPPEEIGVALYSGASARVPDALKDANGFSVINPPLLDRLLEDRWLAPFLLQGTRAGRFFPRSVPVGMGMRTAAELIAFAGELQVPSGFPLAVMKPSSRHLARRVRFMDRTAVRALAARLPERRLPAHLADELFMPHVRHTYEEISSYRGKLLDNLLRTPGAEVHDHGDGTFHFSAPYPFLENTVAMLQEYVEARPVRSRRTGKLHRGSLRAAVFDGRIVAAIYRLDPEPDDGTFRALTRAKDSCLYEAAPPEDEASLQEALSEVLQTLERQIARRVRSDADVERVRREWVAAQTSGGSPAGS